LIGIYSEELHRNPGKTIKYFTTFTNTIYDVLASRGWEEVEGDEDVSFDSILLFLFSFYLFYSGILFGVIVIGSMQHLIKCI
jgi:hypothetical protein